MIDAEGTIKRSHRTSLTVSINMTDRDILERMSSLFGGNISGPRHYPRRKPIWVWNLCGALPCYAVLVALFPWFGARRQGQVRRAVSHFAGGDS